MRTFRSQRPVRSQGQRQVVVNRGRNQDEAVEAIEQASMAGQGRPDVLDADVAFDGRECEVTELSEHADQQVPGRSANRVPRSECPGTTNRRQR